MTIMLVFLSLSIALIICTIIYVNNKKKNDTVNIKQILLKQETKEKPDKKNKKQLFDIFKIKIKDNIICLGNRYSNIIKLGNIDYNMMSNMEQDAIENVLIQTALAIDYPIQFFSTTEFIDTSKVISLLKNNKTNNFKINEYKQNLIEYLQNLMENKTISVVKNYAIISYDGVYEDAIDELSRKSLSFIGNLLRAKVVCEVLNENELYNLIYRELNKNSNLNISNLKEGGQKLYVSNKKKKKEKRSKYI